MTTACGRENKKKLLHLLSFRIGRGRETAWSANGRRPPVRLVEKKEKLGDGHAEFRVYWYFFPPAHFLCLPVQPEVVEPLGGICVAPLAFRTRDASLPSEKKRFACRPRAPPPPLLRDELDTKKGHWVIGAFWRRPRLRYIIYQHVYIPALTDVQLLIGGHRVTYWLTTSAVLYPWPLPLTTTCICMGRRTWLAVTDCANNDQRRAYTTMVVRPGPGTVVCSSTNVYKRMSTGSVGRFAGYALMRRSWEKKMPLCVFIWSLRHDTAQGN